MKNLFLLTITLLFCNGAFAKSTLVATWIEEAPGQKKLIIQIVDNPSESPFMAGELWKAMKSDSGKKSITTANFKLVCSALKNSGGQDFGSCEIQLPASKIHDQLQQISFALSHDEGKEALAGFNSVYPNWLLKYGNGETFMFEANWQHQMLAIVMSKSLISE